MNEPSPPAADAAALQFDQAEFAQPSAGLPVCAACRQTIPDRYFQVAGQVLCERCSVAIQNQLTGGGGSSRRFFKAGLYGFGAAVAGFAIYFGVMKLTGLEIGLISILVGYLVGAAVRKGSEGRGGLLYQFMAVGFTYFAIAISYSALIIPKMIDQIQAEKAKEVAAQPDNAAKADPAVARNPDAEGTAKVTLDSQPGGQPVAQKDVTAADLAIAIAFTFAFVLAIPVLAGFSQPIGLLIVGFALWEAFKMNRKIEIVITGPHTVGPAGDQAAAHV